MVSWSESVESVLGCNWIIAGDPSYVWIAALAGSQLTENHDRLSDAAESLKDVFDSFSIQELRIYRIGDSEAVKGILVAALAQSNQAIAFVF